MNKIKLNSISLNGNSLNKMGEGAGKGIVMDGILAVYDVTSTENPTQIISPTFAVVYVKSMTIDGVDITPAQQYKFNSIGKHYANIVLHDNLTSLYYIFNECRNLLSVKFYRVDLSNCKNMYGLFNNCTSLVSADLRNLDTSNVIEIGNMFAGCTSLVSADLRNLDTSNVIGMSGLFSSCLIIKRVNLSSFDTSKNASLNNFFNHCYKLDDVDLSNFDVGNVVDFNYAINQCYELKKFNPFKNWKKSNFSLFDSAVAPIAVHQLIERSASVADGAEQRTLTLHATTKSNWMASEYYDADVVMANEELITIA